MKAGRSLALLLLFVGCGEPWVTLGQRAPVDAATADVSAPPADASAPGSDAGTLEPDAGTSESDAASPGTLPSNDAAVDSHINDADHACADNTQCTSGGHPFCDTAQGLCVRCLSDLDCDSMDRCMAGDCVSID